MVRGFSKTRLFSARIRLEIEPEVSTSQRQMDDLILEFAWLRCGPDEPEIIEDSADVHVSGKLDDTGDMTATRQVIGKMPRHRGTVIGDQQAAVGLDPD